MTSFYRQQKWYGSGFLSIVIPFRSRRLNRFGVFFARLWIPSVLFVWIISEINSQWQAFNRIRFCAPNNYKLRYTISFNVHAHSMNEEKQM